MLLFTYGTLMRSEANHGLMGDSEFKAIVVTYPWYQLWAPRKGGFPFMTQGTCEVVGELYEVGPEVLAQLDLLEGHPDMYERVPVGVQGYEGVQAYLYPRNPRVPKWDMCDDEGALIWHDGGRHVR